MVNFVVVDDNNLHRKKLINIIISKMMNNKIDFDIKEFSDYEKSLVKYIKNDKNRSIYILDLELLNGDGIEIARMIRDECNNWISPIIIITAHSSLYYEVYKQRLQVLDFIPKCSNIEKNLNENIDICLRMLNIDRVYRFIYKNIEYSINLMDINYIKRDGRGIRIITTDNEYFQNISVNNVKQILPSYFVLSTKGILINKKNVTKIDWNDLIVYFKDKSSGYLVSKTHKKELMESE